MMMMALLLSLWIALAVSDEMPQSDLRTFSRTLIPLDTIPAQTSRKHRATGMDESPPPPSYYDPCDYPRPMDDNGQFALTCQSSYLGSALFCDPDHLFSRTEADVLMEELTKLNVSSCLCGMPSTVEISGQFERCHSSRLKGAVLFARTASVHYRRGTSRSSTYRAGTCRNLIQSSTSHDSTRRENFEKFADDLVRIWRQDARCELDLLFVVINRWYPDLDDDDDASPRLIVYLSSRLQKSLRDLNPAARTRESPVQQQLPLRVSVHKLGRRPSDVLLGLKSIVSMLTKGNFSSILANSRDQRRVDSSPSPSIVSARSITPAEGFIGAVNENGDPVFHPVGTSMPDWAIILFIVCILMLPLCVLIGNLVSVVPSRRMAQQQPDPTSMRWAQKRWRAGFGGGFFGVRWKTQMTTAGDPATAALQTVRPKPQSNNMMFRQFSKFKKPLKSSANTGGGDGGRAASWSYV